MKVEEQSETLAEMKRMVHCRERERERENESDNIESLIESESATSVLVKACKLQLSEVELSEATVFYHMK